MAAATVKQISPAKEALIQKSNSLQIAKEMNLLGSEYDSCLTTNDLLRVFYGLEGLNLKTFNKWKEEGKLVKKGEKGFAFWTSPMNGKRKTEGEDGEKLEGEYKFFGVCYLFSENQVQ